MSGNSAQGVGLDWYQLCGIGPFTEPALLQGGPGCSSELAILYENGPFNLDKEGVLSESTYGWDQVGMGGELYGPEKDKRRREWGWVFERDLWLMHLAKDDRGQRSVRVEGEGDQREKGIGIVNERVGGRAKRAKWAEEDEGLRRREG
eukprot:1159417-Pelagomonas_calceolata.AAC.3